MLTHAWLPSSCHLRLIFHLNKSLLLFKKWHRLQRGSYRETTLTTWPLHCQKIMWLCHPKLTRKLAITLPILHFWTQLQSDSIKYLLRTMKSTKLQINTSWSAAPRPSPARVPRPQQPPAAPRTPARVAAPGPGTRPRRGADFHCCLRFNKITCTEKIPLLC